MKRLIALLLCISMLFSLAVTASADKVASYKTNTHTFTASKTGKLNISFKHDYQDDGFWRVDVYKKNSDGSKTKMFHRLVYANGPTDKFPALGCKKNDKFVLEVSSSLTNACNVDYNIKYSCTSARYEKELNNSYQSATSISFGKTTYANCSYYSNWNDEIDWFKMKAPITGNITLQFKHKYLEGGSGWKISIFRMGSDGSMYNIVDEKNIPTNKATTKFTIKKAKKGTYYYIKVTWPYAGNFNHEEYFGEEYSLKPTIKPYTPGKPSVSVKKGKITSKWKKSSSVSGYQIQISKKSNFKKLVVNKKQKSYKYTKKLSRKTKYYIRVRSYKKVGSKYYYSNWSSKRSFKTK